LNVIGKVNKTNIVENIFAVVLLVSDALPGNDCYSARFSGVADILRTEDDCPLSDCSHTVSSGHDPVFADQGTTAEVGTI